MWSYILKRLLLMIPTLFGILLITFVIIQFVPGGPVEQMVAQLQGRDAAGSGEGPAASQGGYRGRQGVDAARVEEIKKLYGFDKPAPERFVQMLGQFARLDLGKSFFHNKDVWQLIKEKLPVSISLGMWTFLLTYLISVPLGIAKAVRAGTSFDTATTFIVLLGYAIPSFVLGVVLHDRHVPFTLVAHKQRLVVGEHFGDQAQAEQGKEDEQAHITQAIAAEAAPRAASGAFAARSGWWRGAVGWRAHAQSKYFTRGSTHR